VTLKDMLRESVAASEKEPNRPKRRRSA
jgi:hypothetical protein